MGIYETSDDSFLFADFLEKYFYSLKQKNIDYLDMGCGSGILAEVAKNCRIKNILCADINQEAVNLVKKKKFNAVKSNLFSNIDAKFDVISFNAPYLSFDKREPLDSRICTTGGKKGDEISVRFIKEAKKHLKKNGKIFLLVSSLTPMDRINKFRHKIVCTKKIFFEELIILQIE